MWARSLAHWLARWLLQLLQAALVGRWGKWRRLLFLSSVSRCGVQRVMFQVNFLEVWQRRALKCNRWITYISLIPLVSCFCCHGSNYQVILNVYFGESRIVANQWKQDWQGEYMMWCILIYWSEMYFLTNLQIRKCLLLFFICVRAWGECTIFIIVRCWYVCSGLDVA